MTQLFINGTNVSAAWGAYLDESGLIELMKPSPNKEYLSNKSANAHGKAVLLNDDFPAYKDEREITLTISIKQPSQTAMLEAFGKLSAELSKGKIDLYTSFEGNTVVYHLYYESCSTLQTFFRGIAKFTIKFLEPNPANRTAAEG